MDYSKYEQHCSAQRLNRFLDAVNGDAVKAIQLYNLNMRLSQAFFIPLTVFEVALRNRIDHVLSDYFKDKDWILNQKSGFMSDPSLTRRERGGNQTRVENFLKSQVEKAENDLRKRKVMPTAGRIVAEQSLAFWVSFFNPVYFRLLKAAPIKSFSMYGSGKDRSEVANSLDTIRRFRNRIFHHEPICFDQANAINISYTQEVKNSIMEMLDWIDPEICVEFNRFHDVDGILFELKQF